MSEDAHKTEEKPNYLGGEAVINETTPVCDGGCCESEENCEESSLVEGYISNGALAAFTTGLIGLVLGLLTWGFHGLYMLDWSKPVKVTWNPSVGQQVAIVNGHIVIAYPLPTNIYAPNTVKVDDAGKEVKK